MGDTIDDVFARSPRLAYAMAVLDTFLPPDALVVYDKPMVWAPVKENLFSWLRGKKLSGNDPAAILEVYGHRFRDDEQFFNRHPEVQFPMYSSGDSKVLECYAEWEGAYKVCWDVPGVGVTLRAEYNSSIKEGKSPEMMCQAHSDAADIILRRYYGKTLPVPAIAIQEELVKHLVCAGRLKEGLTETTRLFCRDRDEERPLALQSMMDLTKPLYEQFPEGLKALVDWAYAKAPLGPVI